MLRYRKIINEETRQCDVGLGTNEAFYKSLGMELGEVEPYKGLWYEQGYAPQKPLEELKAEKRAEINQERDKAEQGGFKYLGRTFDSDPISCIRIQGAAQMASQLPKSTEPAINWTCKDNSTIMLTVEELLGLSNALVAWSNECHQKATSLKEQIELAKSKEDLDKIVW